MGPSRVRQSKQKPRRCENIEPLNGGSGNLVCRDFLRNVCSRGSNCKYSHIHDTDKNENNMQHDIVFCHDYQNRGDCGRSKCRFIHCKKEEEEEFKRSGFLPRHLRDQAIQKAIAPDLPALFGSRPICKDFLKGNCTRHNCKFRHVSSQQYDIEIGRCVERSSQDANDSSRSEDSAKQSLDHLQDLSTGAQPTFASPSDFGQQVVTVGFEEPMEKRRRVDVVTIEYGHDRTQGIDFQVLQHENMLLKQQLQDLKKQISDLSTTNNFLLEQNAQLRMGIKAEKSSQAGPGGPPSQPQPPPPVVSVDLPAATVSQQGGTITMTMAVPPPSSIAPPPMSMSLPVAQLVTTMTGSPIVNSISVAETQPEGTTITLAPTMQSARPLVTSINVAPSLESAPPSLTLQSISGPPPAVSSIHAVSQPLPPPQTVTIAPNTVQVHETRLVSYPMTSVRPRL